MSTTINEQQPETKRTRTEKEDDTYIGKELEINKASEADNIKNPILKYIENPVAARREEEERIHLNVSSTQQQEINYRNVIFIDRDNDYDNT